MCPALQLALLWLCLARLVISAGNTTHVRIQSIFDGNFSDRDAFFHAAQLLHQEYLKTGGPLTIRQIHLVRIPKAASSSMSAVARRMVGCYPPGPCCKYPGDPAGSCPDARLFQCAVDRKVIGCTGHQGDSNALLSAGIPSITLIREPISRSLSAFHYPGIHHNSDCIKTNNSDRNVCFANYLVDVRWQNVVVKMFAGDFAYSNVTTCRLREQCRHSFQTATRLFHRFAFVGITEMWELSLLRLHHLFPWFKPQYSDFRDLQERKNVNDQYEQFSAIARSKFAQELNNQNRFDLEIYYMALNEFSQALHNAALWHPRIERYWKQRVGEVKPR